MPAYLDDYMDSIGSRPRRSRRSQAELPFELTPEQTTSLLGRIGSGTVGAIGGAANLLDVPGSMARDVIGLAGGGSFERYNPFDQLLDPFGKEAGTNRATGRDLLRGGGLIGKKDTWGNFAGGLGVDIATDPLMYLPPFALTKAGVLAKQTGQLKKAAGVATAKKGARVGPLRAGLDTTLGELPEFSMASRPFTKHTSELLDRASRKAGIGVEDLLSQPLRTGVGVQLPGMGSIGGFNPPGARRAASALDWTGNALMTSAPGRVVKGLFHAPSGGQFTTEGQKLAESIHDARLEAIPQVSKANRDTANMLNPVLGELEQQLGPDIIGAAKRRILDPAEEALKRVQGGDKTLIKQATRKAEAARTAFDNLDHAAEISRVADKLVRGAGERGVKETLDTLGIQHTGDLTNVETAIGKVIESNKQEMNSLAELGFDLKYLDEEQLNHLPRRVQHSTTSFQDKKALDAALESEALMRNTTVDKLPPAVVRRLTDEVVPTADRKLLNTRGMVDTARDVETRHLPTALVDKLLVDPKLRAQPGTAAGQVEATQYILDNYPEFLDPTFASETKPAAAFDIARWAEKNKGIPGFTEKLAEQVKRLDNPKAEHAISQHANDLAAYIRRHPRRERYTNTTLADQAAYRKSLEMKKAAGKAVHDFLRESAKSEGDIGLAEAFTAAKMNPETSLNYFARQAGIDPQDAANLRVSFRDAAAMRDVLSVAKEPAEWAQRVGGIIDSVNNMLRAPLTIIWPAFHSRNSVTGQFVNVATGLMDTAGDYATYADSVFEAARVAKSAKSGGDSELIRELVDYQDVIFGKGGRGVSGEHLIQGATFQDIPTEALKVPNLLKKVPGVKTAAKGYEKALGLGQKAMEKVEFSNRVPLYIYLRKKGWEPLQAAMEVEKRHFDYSQVTPFERNVMKRATLFYTFTRRMAPLVLESLIKQPGGAMAQTIKAAGRSGSRDEHAVPDYIRDQSSIFSKQLPDGSLRYITGFGLPYEDILSFGSSPIKEALSRTTPLIKAPAELAFGKSLFQKGRDLEDLDPNIGRTLSNIGRLAQDPSKFITGGDLESVDPVRLPQSLEFLSANSPVSRALTSARTLTDTRKSLGAKAWNLLTGVRVADISPASQDAELREEAAKAMKRLGGKSFTRTYLPKDRREKMSPESQLDALLLDSLMSELARRAKERKAATSRR